ncbi:MAG: NADH-quinone oxidoreductase subunit G [Candidatus Nanopelagicales bacterium]
MSTVAPVAGSSAPPADAVTCTIDGVQIQVPKGTLIIRAAELIGIEVPRFCDHPLLDPVAACRACLVEIEGMPKPQPACAIPVAEDMVVKTQVTSEVADTAQRGVMEFLLINHPLDCPVCDKGGECPLQNQAMTHGNGSSRFDGTKRTFAKPVAVSSQILLDRERCVSCARCTRFADEIAGDPLIELFERGAKQQVATGPDAPFDSYFSGNTVQICPVGALTSSDYRFRARPFDLVSTPTACEHCASGCAIRTDSRNSTVMRRLAAEDPEVNEDWNCDKGRFAFKYLSEDRIKTPLIRDPETQEFYSASWPEALDLVADKLADYRGRTGVITGGRLTRDDAYAYAKFARVALGGDDIDFRVRASSQEEVEFLSNKVAGTGLGVTYSDIESSPMVLLAGLEPEDEAASIFLRLRKGVLAGSTKVASVSSWVSPGSAKLQAVVLAAAPGDEAMVIDALLKQSSALSEAGFEVSTQLRNKGAVILVGERLAASPGALSAVAALAEETGAKLAWVPRRAGDRGALDAGALAGLLPGGRSLTDQTARAEIAQAWGINESDLPAEPGLDLAGILEALTTEQEVSDETESAVESADVEASEEQEVADEALAEDSAKAAVDQIAEEVQLGDDEPQEPRIDALVLGGVDIRDVPNIELMREALREASFVVNLETRLSGISAYADVVLPVAVDIERIGAYANWEGRLRQFPKVNPEATAQTDGRVLAMIADEMGYPIGTGDVVEYHNELDSLGYTTGERVSFNSVKPGSAETPGSGEAVLASWKFLLDLGMLQTGDDYLAGTRRPSVARLSPATAQSIGVTEGDLVKVSSDQGTIELPLLLTDMPDGVVWVPQNSPGSEVYATLGDAIGSTVRIAGGPKAVSDAASADAEVSA